LLTTISAFPQGFEIDATQLPCTDLSEFLYDAFSGHDTLHGGTTIGLPSVPYYCWGVWGVEEIWHFANGAQVVCCFCHVFFKASAGNAALPFLRWQSVLEFLHHIQQPDT